MCDSKDLIMSDVSLLPPDSFTHVNTGSLSRAWLDHCITSPFLHNSIVNTQIDYTGNASDHLPLSITFRLDNIPKMYTTPEMPSTGIDWDFKDHEKLREFYNLLSYKLSLIQVSLCHQLCNSINHQFEIDKSWNSFVESVIFSGEIIFGKLKKKNSSTPGWTEYIVPILKGAGHYVWLF